MWISQELIDVLNAGKAPLPKAGNGRPFSYSDPLIELLLMMRHLYKLPLRQLIGFAKSFFAPLGLRVGLPNFSTLSRRGERLNIHLDALNPSCGPIHIAIDSTGLKVYAEGEWKVRQHGIGKRRTWRKITFAVDLNTFETHAVVMTENNVHDCVSGIEALNLIEGNVTSVRGDGAYDTEDMRATIQEMGATPVIPPREGAVAHPEQPNLAERNAALQFMTEKMAEGLTLIDARKAWKVSVGYHQRSKVETHMYRFKNTFGDKFQARTFENQGTEILLKTKLLNRLTRIGMPKILKVA